MTPQAFALFDTPIGTCGVAWNKKGIAGMQLPAANADKTRAHIRKRWPSAVEAAPPPGVRRAIDRVLTLLKGEKIDLTDIPDRKSTRLNSSHIPLSRMPSSA